ncbi:MAG: hypothetical protein FJ404_17915 [Verrucomicrobia bacterium]|nr:hypothetical protein [Verrucomicrobiota bacterium]
MELEMSVHGEIELVRKRGSFLFFVQDHTAGIYVYHPGVDLDLRPGQRVRIQGAAGPGRFTPIVLSETVTKLPGEGFPVAKRIAVSRLHSGAEDSQWVQMEGQILSSREVPGMVILDMAHGSHPFLAMLIKTGGGFPTLATNSLVRIRGVVGAMFDSSHKTQVFHVYIPGSAFIESIPPASPGFVSPAHADPTELLRGKAVWVWPGELMIVKGDATVRRVEPLETNQVTEGAAVEVRGSVRAARFSDILTPVSIHVLESGQPPTDTVLDPIRAYSGHFDGALARIEGVVLASYADEASFPWLLLQWTNRLIRVQLPKPLNENDRLEIETGSRVQVRGLVETDDSDDRSGGDLRILARSRNDVKVIRRTSLFSPPSFGWAAAGSVGLLLGGGGRLGVCTRFGPRSDPGD